MTVSKAKKDQKSSFIIYTELQQMNRSKLTIYKLCTAAILALVAVVGLISFLAFFEGDARYFKSSPIAIILYIILAIAVIVAISAAFLSKKIVDHDRRHRPVQCGVCQHPCLGAGAVVAGSFLRQQGIGDKCQTQNQQQCQHSQSEKQCHAPFIFSVKSFHIHHLRSVSNMARRKV